MITARTQSGLYDGCDIAEGPLDAAARAALVFDGALIVHREVPAMHALIAAADAHLRDAFSPHQPETAERYLPADDYRACVGALAKQFAADETIQRLYNGLFIALGVDPNETYRDRLRLRILPSDRRLWDGRIRALAPHRDNWGSNLAAQINWWAPVYPLAPSRTMLLYPGYWQRAVRNSSANWDYDALRANVEAGAAYPRLPVVREPVASEGAVPVRIRPGDVLCFSGAHLHAGVADDSGIARISTDTRTVSQADLEAGRGACNIDGAAPRTPLSWFRHMTRGTLLSALPQDINQSF